MSARQCNHAKQVGFVTNQDPNEAVDLERALFSRAVCGRPGCHETAAAWVKRNTGERGVFYPFGNYSRGGAA